MAYYCPADGQEVTGVAMLVMLFVFPSLICKPDSRDYIGTYHINNTDSSKYALEQQSCACNPAALKCCPPSHLSERLARLFGGIGGTVPLRFYFIISLHRRTNQSAQA